MLLSRPWTAGLQGSTPRAKLWNERCSAESGEIPKREGRDVGLRIPILLSHRPPSGSGMASPRQPEDTARTGGTAGENVCLTRQVQGKKLVSSPFPRSAPFHRC